MARAENRPQHWRRDGAIGSRLPEAIRVFSRDTRFASDLVRQLEPLAGFRNVVIHESVALDLDRVIEALGRLEPIEPFIAIVGHMERTE